MRPRLTLADESSKPLPLSEATLATVSLEVDHFARGAKRESTRGVRSPMRKEVF